MDPLDTSWCPGCSRQILPKRYTVPVYPIQSEPHPTPAPPPSSPSSSSSEKASTQSRQTRATRSSIRSRAGLARGTGRVKPNGAIKRTESKKEPAPHAAPAIAPQVAPLRHRTVIDQNPTPLYCSDECRLADLDLKHSGIALDFNPHRDPCASPTLPPVPHNSLSNSSDEMESESTTSSSPDSRDDAHASDYVSWDPSVAALAKMYNFPPPPSRPNCVQQQEEDERESHPTMTLEDTYTSGVMMAAQRIKDTLCSQPKKPSHRVSAYSSRDERKPIPGWTDGSDGWRATVYSFSSPKDNVIHDLKKPDERPRAYGSFAASPHRSTGVYSNVSENPTPTASVHTRVSTADDVSNYPMVFARRSDSRTSLSSQHAQSLPVATRSLLAKGAEGKLLVPDVQLPIRSPSSYSTADTSSVSTKSWRSNSHRSLVRSPLSRYGSDLSAEEVEEERHSSHKVSKRPSVETRSWSYDNMLTYDVMPMPSRKETRLERKVVNGVQVVVETEVVVPPQMKRLFLFPGKEIRRV